MAKLPKLIRYNMETVWQILDREILSELNQGNDNIPDFVGTKGTYTLEGNNRMHILLTFNDSDKVGRWQYRFAVMISSLTLADLILPYTFSKTITLKHVFRTLYQRVDYGRFMTKKRLIKLLKEELKMTKDDLVDIVSVFSINQKSVLYNLIGRLQAKYHISEEELVKLAKESVRSVMRSEKSG